MESAAKYRTKMIPMMKVIAYYRVSTKRQGKSGLGLAAQKKSVADYIRVCHLKLLQEYTEVESGRKVKYHPMLLKAIAACMKSKATLLIAKLDRLARNVAFVSALKESKLPFIAVDNPTANKFMIHIQAAVAENESDTISERTRLALAAAKRRGIKLGQFGKLVLSKRNRRKANAFARKMKPIIRSLMKQGHSTIRQLTDILNKKHVPTFTGHNSKWHLRSVHNLLKRIGQLNIHP